MESPQHLHEMSTYRKYFQNHLGFYLDKNVFYQKGFQGMPDFVNNYLNIRKSEGRLYSDHVVLTLPDGATKSKELGREWIIRRRSANRLIDYLKRTQHQKIIEIGCGNGWLINYISKSLDLDYCGIDINKVEIEQAARLFSSQKVNFIFADINSQNLSGLKADVFILAGVIQYLFDLRSFVQRLLSQLNPKGEIHILDSPFYSNEDWGLAKARGDRHFDRSGVLKMKEYYFYQKYESIESFRYEVLYNPSSIIGRLVRKMKTDSPFPWIKITDQ